MSTASPSIEVIRAQIRAIRSKAPNAKVFGIFAAGRWTGKPIVGSGEDAIAIYQCDSLLQMRLALQQASDNVSASVLVTPLDQGKISADVLVRLAQRKLHPLNRWEIVRSLFKAKHLDPRITRHAFLADLLIECADGRDVPPVAGGFLDADTVWPVLLSERLGLSRVLLDAVELLRCTAEADLARLWKANSPGFRDAAKEWIGESAGEVATAVLGCLDCGHGPRALAVGLVMGVVFHPGVGNKLDKAAGRLEAYAGATNIPPEIARRWGDAAAAAASQLSDFALRRCLEDAQAIVENIGAKGHEEYSDELDKGFEQRLSKMGRALAADVGSTAAAKHSDLQELLANILRHRLGRIGVRRVERVKMALRLWRWLAGQDLTDVVRSPGLVAAAQAYAKEGGFVDWARQVLRGGEPNTELAAAFGLLVERATKLREAQNHQFARALLDQQAMGNPVEGLIPVEHVLEAVVAKAADLVPVLVLLVDGMSWAVFRELATDVSSHNWIELGWGQEPERLVGLAALPSVTEVCRTSLLCGRLRRGRAADEVQAFTAHPILLATSQSGFPPRLFHKASIEGAEDPGLAPEIRDALADKKQRVVGIVINAVDDHLDKGDQVDAVWTVQHIRALEPILAEARSAGRLVVLLSDHGHILDRQTECHDAPDGLRWRRPGGPLRDGELELSSPRVVMPDGGTIVVPWSERLRYGSKRNGYHGGATPQEMLIPLALFWPRLQPPDGFGEVPMDFPSWWTESTAVRPATPAAKPKPSAKPAGPMLFDPAGPPKGLLAPSERWIRALLKSSVFVARRSRLPDSGTVDDVAIHGILAAVANREGSMTVRDLALVVGEPEQRLVGRLRALQTALNVDGFAVLSLPGGGKEVRLDVPLLKKQFELGP